jgi:hypothetical protein
MEWSMLKTADHINNATDSSSGARSQQDWPCGVHTENSLFQINKINYSSINDFFTGGELNFYL